jgi:hypothetical protein
MAWRTPKTWADGQHPTAADFNAYVSENMDIIRGGGIAVSGQTAGELAVASSSSQLVSGGPAFLNGALETGRLRVGAASSGAIVNGTIYQDGIVRAWALIDVDDTQAGAGPSSVITGFNVNDTTDISIGQTQLNFHTALPTNYVAFALPIGLESIGPPSTAADFSTSVSGFNTTDCTVTTFWNRASTDNTFAEIPFQFFAIGGY